MSETQGQMELRRNLQHATREELLEIIVERNGSGRKYTAENWFDYYMAADHELNRLRSLLRSEYHNDKSLRHAQHVADLESKNKKLREEVREMQVCAERHNRLLYATGLIVNCTGCDRGGPFNAEELTEEKVNEVELLARRLRSWWNNHQWRLRRAAEQESP